MLSKKCNESSNPCKISSEPSQLKKIIVNEKKLNKTILSVHDTILNKLFGGEYINVKTLLQTSSNLAGDSYELELRVIDESTQYGGHTSKKNWYMIPESELILQSYDDDVIYSYATSIPINNVKFRSSEKTGLYERKILINSISSRSENKSIIPLNIKLSKETIIQPTDELSSYVNIQRKQRCSYKFKDPYLSDWRVDKTIRFISYNPNDKKITFPLDIDNINTLKYYDYLDLEIEFIGDFRNLFNSFFKLIEKIYPSFVDFNINYNIIKTILSINPIDLFPSAKILTEDIVSKNKISNYYPSYNIDGERREIIIINQNIYELTKYSFREIYDENKYEQSINGLSILDRLLSYQKIRKQSVQYFVTVLDCEYYDNIYYVIDVYCHKSNITNDLLYNERIKIIKDFLRTSEIQFVKENMVLAPLIHNCNTWNDFLNIIENAKKITYLGKDLPIDGAICRLNNSSFINAICLKSKDKRQSTIDFKIMYIVSKRIFYVYVRGNVNNVIKNVSIFNRYSQEHFGYSLVNYNSSMEKYILFLSPYLDTFEFKPRLNWDVSGYNQKQIEKINKLMTNIYTHPLSYNGSVVEMSLANDGWVPVKIRKNSEPSNYIDSMNIMSLLYNNFSEVITHEKDNTLQLQLNYKHIYTIIYNLIDQYIIEKYFNNYDFNNIIDIYDPMNINVNDLYILGNVNNFYAINSNRSSLIRYVNASMNHEINKSIFLQNTKLIYGRILDINIINEKFNSDNNNIFSNLIKKYGYKMNSIDAIYVQDQSDEIFSSFIKTIAFVKFCERTLSPNGKIIIKFYDGERINNMIENNKNNHLNIRKISDVDDYVNHCCDSNGNNDNNNNYRILSENANMNTNMNVNVESIDSVISESNSYNIELNDDYQWENIVIPIEPTNESTHTTYKDNILSISVNNITYNLTIQNINNICPGKFPVNTFYYHTFKKYDNNGLFISEKLLSKQQTLNLNTILDIDTELISNMYDHVLEKWYSIYHNVDHIFGSLNFTQSVIRHDIESNILIESQHLNQDIINFIKLKRINIKYNTVIVTKTVLEFLQPFYVINTDCIIYVIFSNILNDSDKLILSNYLVNTFTDPNKLIYEKYLHPDIERGTFIPRNLTNKDFLNFFTDKFNMVDICQPMTRNEISKYISTNRNYSQIEIVEEFLSSLTVVILERK